MYLVWRDAFDIVNGGMCMGVNKNRYYEASWRKPVRLAPNHTLTPVFRDMTRIANGGNGY